ncbi:MULTISPECIES: hypothetical protein [Bacillus]|uniref:Group-specific protein n=2 Tax=Bacillus cereus group TaxID=86661 RepID=A0AAW4QVU5_BACCE|nr:MULTISPECIES: hypothetical protein [Bacillus cereus group]AHX17226.1 hypothetical protein CY96_04205 [Bacillus bombysepticus str. Wang]MBY0037439.1 hypothetical protein [Bacillus cereus]HDR7806958.1 hypothetical protein [Bacillus cereus]
MAHKSTGVFRVPVSESGIIPTALNIMLNNDSRCHTSNVTVTVKRSRNTFFPTQNELVEISRTFVSLEPNRTTKIVLFTPEFQVEDFLDVIISGNKEDVKDVLVYSFLADSVGHNLPSTVFRNAEYTFAC